MVKKATNEGHRAKAFTGLLGGRITSPFDTAFPPAFVAGSVGSQTVPILALPGEISPGTGNLLNLNFSYL